MAMRLESTSAGPMGSGFLPLHEGSQPPAPQVVASKAHLPERYGVPLLELLVVDPYFVFISWEITEQQLDQARSMFGAEFNNRRLRVRLSNAETGGELSSRELYGDIGRWFIQLNVPGVWLRAELQYLAGGDSMELNSAGPVFVPRDAPVEPECWEELFVNYSRSEKDELRIESIEREGSAAWPKITLEPPTIAMSASDSDGSAGYLSSCVGARQRVDTGLLRPLLPIAPASVEAEDD
jgi:hypothetical protein